MSKWVSSGFAMQAPGGKLSPGTKVHETTIATATATTKLLLAMILMKTTVTVTSTVTTRRRRNHRQRRRQEVGEEGVHLGAAHHAGAQSVVEHAGGARVVVHAPRVAAAALRGSVKTPL